ncbi:uncharacterized protein LOC123030225 isoform X2 [Varanus komodoensis]|nr:uncharacterized protein LOC123030225 isoform X2 [Varanus komodoensis]
MWVQLQQNEPQLLGNLKEFLAKMTHLIMEAKQEKEKLELMLKIRVAEHNKEVQQLYEEMEEQIESEKQRLQNESKTRNQLLSMEMKKALDFREQEIQRFLSVQKELEKQFLSLKEKQHVASTETQQLKQANSVLENQLQQTLHQLQRTQRHLDAMKDKMAQMYKQGRDRPLEEVSEKMPQRPQDLLHPDEMFSSQLQMGLVRSQSEDILDSSAHQAPDDVASMTKADSQPVTRVISIEEEPLPGTVVEEYYFPPEPSGQNSLFTELNEAIALMNKMSESHTPQINDFGSQEQEPFEQNGNSQHNLMPERAPPNEVLSKNNGLQKMISETLTGNATSQAEILLKGGPALEMKQTNIFEPRVEVSSSEPVQRRNCGPVVQSLGYSVLVTQTCDHKEGPLQGDALLLEQVIQPESRNQCPSVDSEKGMLKQSQEMQTPIRKIPETQIPPMKDMPSVHFPTKKTLPMLHERHEHEANISLFQNSQLGNSSEMEMRTSEGTGVLLSEDRGERLANVSEYKKNQEGRAEKGEQTNDKLEDHSCQGNDTKEAYKDTTTVCSHPDHMYNVLFVGDSYVGKTSFLHRFQDGSFIANMTSTVGMDYRIKHLFVDNKYFALCLWDTVGQERYHSLTKQFFRKADGVVLMYDITSEYSFANVRYWLHCIQEGAGKGVIILLLGNKTDCVKERRVSTQDAAYLAKDFSPENMELSASELSIYDKLSETIDLVRQTGYQCGMSEKAIEKFIRQLLEKNEPQRGPPRYPLLMFLYKGLVTLGLVLLTVYFMIQPYSLSPPETTLSRAYAWGSLLSHIRLLPLPITKKYMLEMCQDWWGLDYRQNVSLTANWSCCCSMKKVEMAADLGQLSEKLLQPQPLLIKTGQYRSYAEMKHFQSLYPDLTDFVIQEHSAEEWKSHLQQQSPSRILRQSPMNKPQIVQEIFPMFTSLMFPKAVSLNTCFLINHPRLQDKTYRLQSIFVVGSGQLTLHVVPSALCRGHCKMLTVELEVGDVGFANEDYWTLFFDSRGSEPAVVCDGSAS